MHCDRAVLALVLLLEMTLVQEAIVAVHSSAIMPHKDACTCCFCPAHLHAALPLRPSSAVCHPPSPRLPLLRLACAVRSVYPRLFSARSSLAQAVYDTVGGGTAWRLAL